MREGGEYNLSAFSVGELISPANLELIGDYHDDDVDGDDHDDSNDLCKQKVIMMMISRQLVRMRGSPQRSGLFRSLLPLKIQIRRWKLQQPPGEEYVGLVNNINTILRSADMQLKQSPGELIMSHDR